MYVCMHVYQTLDDVCEYERHVGPPVGHRVLQQEGEPNPGYITSHQVRSGHG